MIYLTINQQILQQKVDDTKTYFAAGYAEEPDNPDGTSNYSQEFTPFTLTPF